MADLVGEYRHKLDSKGRITLPSAFRKVLPTDLKVAISPQDDECLYVFEPDGFSAWVDSLFGEEGYNPNNRKHVMFRRVLNARAKDAQIDAAGRISISAEQREAVGLEKDVVLAGNTDHLEIWDAKRWDDMVNSVDLSEMFH